MVLDTDIVYGNTDKSKKYRFRGKIRKIFRGKKPMPFKGLLLLLQ